MIALPIRAEAPCMVGASDRFTLDLPALPDDEGGRVLSDMRAHMRAIGTYHIGLAALSPINDEVLAEKADAERRRVDLFGIRHHEPTTGVDMFAQRVIDGLCH